MEQLYWPHDLQKHGGYLTGVPTDRDRGRGPKMF